MSETVDWLRQNSDDGYDQRIDNRGHYYIGVARAAQITIANRFQYSAKSFW